MGLFRTAKKDYIACEHGVRSQLRQTKFDQFTPAVLGLGDISAPSVERNAVCASFDLQGFTSFCGQVDPHLVLPEFLSKFLGWLFGSIRKHWTVEHYEHPIPGYVPAYTRLPFAAKFMGDGVLFLWDVSGLPENAIFNVPAIIMEILGEYRRSFGLEARRSFADAPEALRCGIARGKVFSVGNGQDFVGPCINLAARLQKLGLCFALSRRGFDADRHSSPAVREWLVLKKVHLRGIGEDELIWIDRGEFDYLSPEEHERFQDP